MRSKLPFWGLHPAERHAPLPRALGMWGALSFTAAQRGTGNTDPCETAVLCICRTVITKDQFCPKKTIKKVRSQNGGSGPLRLIRRRPCFQGQAGGRRGWKCFLPNPMLSFPPCGGGFKPQEDSCPAVCTQLGAFQRPAVRRKTPNICTKRSGPRGR